MTLYLGSYIFFSETEGIPHLMLPATCLEFLAIIPLIYLHNDQYFLIGRWQKANAHIRSPKQVFQVDSARAHWSLADLLFLKHIPLNYSWRQALSSSQSTMDNLIRFYNFLDLTSVGKGNTLVSQARASNVIVIMGFGMVLLPLVTGCHMLFCAFRELGRVKRKFRGGEKCMNQSLGVPRLWR